MAMILYNIFGGLRYHQAEKPQSTAFEFGIFEGLVRVAWSVAVCYIIFACARNYGGPVNWFLSHPLWQPFSRLSYAIYLIHYPIVQILASAPLFDENKAFQLFTEVCGFSIFAAIPATLAFVSPFDAINTLIFNSRNRIQSTKQKN